MNLPANAPRCLACGSDNFQEWSHCRDIEYYTTDDVFTFYKCLDCDVLFIDPVPLDRLSEIYPSNYYSLGRRTNLRYKHVKNGYSSRFAYLSAK